MHTWDCTAQSDSTIRGVTFYYPDVKPDEVPVPYPYTIYFLPGAAGRMPSHG